MNHRDPKEKEKEINLMPLLKGDQVSFGYLSYMI
jgi:hypothetical protein